MIRLTEVGGEVLAIECPYHEEWLKEFKEKVPYEGRDPKQELGWDKTDKLWRVNADYTEVVEELCVKHFPTTDIEWEYED